MGIESNQVFSTVPPYPVKFYAIPMERVWGGQSLKPLFQPRCASSIPEGPVGEYWVLSGHPNGTSIVSNGPYQGRSLVELTASFPKDYLGNSMQSRFPLLIKFLEAEDDLSVQVHPSDKMAQEVEGDYGKTEAWYVLECNDDGRVVYGHNFSSRDELQDAFSSGTISNYLCYRDIHPKDTVFVPSQTLHALLAGTKVIEVQQTSDVTYRVYDWDRASQDGTKRALHLDKAAQVLFGSTDSDDSNSAHHRTYVDRSNDAAESLHSEIKRQRRMAIDGGKLRTLVECAYFDLYELTVDAHGSAALDRQGADTPDIVIGVEGTGKLRWADGEELLLEPGDTCLIPTSLREVHIEADPEADAALTLLIAGY